MSRRPGSSTTSRARRPRELAVRGFAQRLLAPLELLQQVLGHSPRGLVALAQHRVAPVAERPSRSAGGSAGPSPAPAEVPRQPQGDSGGRRTHDADLVPGQARSSSFTWVRSKPDAIGIMVEVLGFIDLATRPPRPPVAREGQAVASGRQLRLLSLAALR